MTRTIFLKNYENNEYTTKNYTGEFILNKCSTELNANIRSIKLR